MKWYLILGTLSFVILIAVLGVVAINEPVRMERYARGFDSRRIEQGAAVFETNCRTCHGPQGRGVEGLAPAINTPAMFNGERLEQVGYTGTLADYLEGVISAGRPVPSEGANYPQRMPAWAQELGGPLRDDQIENLVAFMQNWEDRALAEGPQTTPIPPQETFGTDITAELPEPDPERGERLASSLGCDACHVLADVGPSWPPDAGEPGIGERAETRFEQDNYTGQATSATEYLVESIVLPDVFVVEGYGEAVMPGDYPNQLTSQEVADLVAYMLSLR